MMIRPAARLAALALITTVGCGASCGEASDRAGRCERARVEAEASTDAFEAGELALALERADVALGLVEVGDRCPALALALGARGAALIQLGRHDEAVTALEAARSALDPIGAADEHSRISQRLGAALDHVGRLDDAESVFRQEVARAERAGDPVALAFALANLGTNLAWQERDADALPVLERSIALAERAPGVPNRGIDGALDALATIHLRQGDRAAAASEWTRAITEREALLGPDHPTVATLLYNLTSALLDLDRPEEAREPIERCLRIRRAALPPDHPWLVETEERAEGIRSLLDPVR
jgi:tetratricopeptide (TPR) repeat protein